MRDLIFLSLENWDEVWRRNQFLCADLARRFPRRRILFVGESVFLPQLAQELRSHAGRVRARTALRRRFWRVPELPNIHVFNPIKPLPNPVPGARAINESWQIAQVKRAARRAGVRDPLLWINPYDSGFYIGRLGEGGVIYDITDDWELAARTLAAKARIAAQDRALCERADLTVVCSRALYQSREAICKNLLLLPNGVEAEHYAHLDRLDDRTSGSFNKRGEFVPTDGESVSAQNVNGESVSAQSVEGDRWPRPVFGYTGTLHRERIDLELVRQLASAYPSGSVVLIGPHNWTDDALRAALAAHPNLHAPGPVAYRDIPATMARFDVCIVPHQRSEFMDSLNPIKLWEYLAAGKPMVSTDVAGFRDYPQWVRLANDAPSFVAACRAALCEIGTAEGEKLKRERRAEALAHSWTARTAQLLHRWNLLGWHGTDELGAMSVGGNAATEAATEAGNGDEE